MKKILPLVVLLVAIGAVVKSLLPPRNSGAFDVVGFGQLPVLANGRIKPLDTLARSSLLQLQGRQEVYGKDGQRLVGSPTEWLLDLAFRAEKADTYPTFVVDNPDLLALLGQAPGANRRYSFEEIWPHRDAIQKQAQLAGPVESAIRTPFQRGVLQLYGNLVQYQGLKHIFVMPAHDDFLGELLHLQDKLKESVAAIEAKKAGQPHDEALVKSLIEVVNHFGLMESVSTFLVIPPDNAESDPTD